MREFTLSDIVVQKSLEPISVGPVGNQVELQQVLMNLLKNAKEAYDINEDVEKRVVKIEVFTAHDGSVTISVIDYAGDIPDEVAARIFDRYFTTKQGTGTGLGLHISRQIIEEMGGTLSLNRQGCCNSFDILFPKQALSHVSDQ